MVLPAAMERNRSCGRTRPAQGLMASSIICGFTARTTASGRKLAGSSSPRVTWVMPLSARSPSTAPAGSTTTTRAGASPRANQPRSMAPPILPQPTSSSFVFEKSAMTMSFPGSGFPDRLEHGRRHRLVRALAAPEQELEGGIEALAFGYGDIDQILELLRGNAARTPQQDRMAEHGLGLLQGKIEMPEPEFFVHAPQELQEGAPAMARHPHVDDAGEADGAQILLPDEKQPIVRPPPSQFDRHLLGGIPVEAPLVGVHQFFQDIEGIVANFGSVDRETGHERALLGPRRRQGPDEAPSEPKY